MDVKISYGIELDEVPSKISSMLSAFTAVEVDHLIDMATQLLEISSENASMSSELISQARLKMAQLDRTLNDTQMILAGYIAAVDTEDSAKATTEVPNAN